MAAGNGVRFCDDSILETQEPFMTQTYNDWDWQEWKSSTGAISGGSPTGSFQYFMHKTEGGCAGLVETAGGALTYNFDSRSSTVMKKIVAMHTISSQAKDGIYCNRCFMLIGTASRISVSYTMQQLRFIAYAGGGSIAHVGLRALNGQLCRSRSLAPSSLAGSPGTHSS